MIRYIDADALQNAMYHEAFETDTEMQRWDSGCWIRYKLFENILDQQPTADVVEVVRCKDCKWFGDNECLDPRGLIWALGDNYCSLGERREDDKGRSVGDTRP